MAESVHVNFPSQVVSDCEKMSPEYGLRVAKAIESEWFNSNGSGKYHTRRNSFHQRRLYARGEQPVQKYKDELSINGDLSYLNIDWRPVPIIPKFVDIIVNGMSSRLFKVKAYSQDPYGVKARTEYMESLQRDMGARDFNDQAAQAGLNLYENDPSSLPETEEELALHMQLDYKPGIEIAEEQAIQTLLDGARYDLIRERFYYDLTVLGIGATKTEFDWSEGAKPVYVDPDTLVYSYTESPFFDDIYYVGEVKTVPINELAKQFPTLSHEELEEIQRKAKRNGFNNRNNFDDADNNKVTVLYFNYKTYMNNVYKIKETGSGGEKAIPKDDTFNPPADMEGGYSKLQKSPECLYEGVLVLGTDILLQWEMAKNMMRPKSDFNKVRMNYSIVAPRMYNGKIESTVSRVMGFGDMINLTHYKLQQLMSRLMPDGVYLDADGLAEIDLGNGTNYNPQEALNMFFQTGSVIGRSFTADGDPNPGKVPIQPINNNNSHNKIGSLIGAYNHYLQMIRDTTGLNEARDASTPDSRTLVGLQKMAAASSNVATRHILDAGLLITAQTAENLSLRISDILEYSPTADAFVQAIGSHNVATLKEMSELHLYDFGIFIELEPDEEEKQMLENNIQTALSAGLIELDDAIDIRQIRNVKLANQLLKVKRKKKAERDQAIQQQNMQAQAQANAQSQQAAAQAEMQKEQNKANLEMQAIQAKAQADLTHLQTEVALKKDLMQFEFELNQQLRDAERASVERVEAMKEQGKDIREGQKERGKDAREAKKFESSGNDVLSGGMGLGAFNPRVGT